MCGLGPYAEDHSCRAVHRATAECFRGLRHLATAEHGLCRRQGHGAAESPSRPGATDAADNR